MPAVVFSCLTWLPVGITSAKCFALDCQAVRILRHCAWIHWCGGKGEASFVDLTRVQGLDCCCDLQHTQARVTSSRIEIPDLSKRAARGFMLVWGMVGLTEKVSPDILVKGSGQAVLFASRFVNKP